MRRAAFGVVLAAADMPWVGAERLRPVAREAAPSEGAVVTRERLSDGRTVT